MEDCVAQAKPLLFSPLLFFKKAILKTTVIKTALLRRANDESDQEENYCIDPLKNIFERRLKSSDDFVSYAQNEKRLQCRRAYLRFWEGARRRHIDSRSQWREKLNRHLQP